MQLKNEIFNDPNFVPTLRELNSMRLPVRVSYPINQLFKDIEDQLKLFVEERQKLFTSYGEFDEGKQEWKVVEDDKKEPFMKEMEELLGMDFAVKRKAKIKLPGDIELSAAQLTSVDGLFDFDFEEDEEN